MNLFDWMDAWYNDFTSKPSELKGTGFDISISCYMRRLFLRLTISLLIVSHVLRQTIAWATAIGLKESVIYSGLFILYCFLGYLIRPQPDTSNLGWRGGLVNNPFRISDDINRFLLFFKLLLWPGRFISESIVDSIGLFLRNNHISNHAPKH